MPCLFCVMWNMAQSHTIRSSLVAAKIIPAVSDVWVRQALHCHSARFFSSQCAKPPHAGHAKPSRQRQEKAPRGIFSSFRRAARTPRPTGLVETAPCCLPSCTSLTAIRLPASSGSQHRQAPRRIRGKPQLTARCTGSSTLPLISA